MLTTEEKRMTARQLRENYKRLGWEEDKVLRDLQFTREELEDALGVCEKGIANPADVWKLRDYLEEKMAEQGKEMLPFSVLIPHRNLWFSYRKTW